MREITGSGWTRWASITAALAATACSGRPDPGTPDSGTDAGDESAASEDSGSGLCDSTCQASVFPLAVGMQWQYRFASGALAGCTDGVTRIVMESGTDPAQGTYFRTQFSCGPSPTVDFAPGSSGVHDRLPGAEWYLDLSLPPSDTAMWAAGGASGARYTWSAVDTVTVAAGTFASCWRRTEVGDDESEVYCPGVGIVSTRWRAFGQDVDLELVARNF